MRHPPPGAIAAFDVDIPFASEIVVNVLPARAGPPAGNSKRDNWYLSLRSGFYLIVVPGRIDAVSSSA